jgi:4'-phosphopantetheinyl transferase EntD
VSAALAFSRETAFGRLVGVALPADGDAAALEALAATLRPEERDHAATLSEARRATFIGGRVALRAAMDALGVQSGPLLATPRGAAILPPGVAGSISHKETLAVALAAPAPDDETLGVDVELDRAPRVDIAPRVLTPGERARVDALEPAARTREILVAFSAKEALYKALDPWLRRFVSWQEVEVTRAPDGALAATLRARPGEVPLSLELREESAPGLVIVEARVHPGAPSRT